MAKLNFCWFRASLLSLLFLAAAAKSSRADIIYLATGLDASNNLISRGASPIPTGMSISRGEGPAPPRRCFPAIPTIMTIGS